MTNSHQTEPQGKVDAPVVDGTAQLERRNMDDIRDRLARAEQDIKNQKENFVSFKTEEYSSLKTEVHQMRGEFNQKLDALLEKIGSINLTMAKWTGALGVVIFAAEWAAKYFLK